LKRLAAITVSLCVLVGAGGAVVALYGRGGQGPSSLAQRHSLASHPSPVEPAALAALVGRAPEPVVAVKRTRLLRARCLPGPEQGLRNPWSCQLRYRSGTLVRYRVVVRPNGYYRGVGPGIVEGCCVETPQLD
jgi:hypothetical protein